MKDGGFSRGPGRVVYSGRFDVVEYDVGIPAHGGGGHVVRHVVRHRGAVTIAAVEDATVTLVRQYRAAADAVLVELPAGKLDSGEAPSACAARELEEETGLVPGSLTEIAEFLVSPGWSDERMWLYLAEGLEQGTARPQGVEETSMEIDAVPLERAVQMCHNGTIRDAKSIVGILLARDHLQARSQ